MRTRPLLLLGLPLLATLVVVAVVVGNGPGDRDAPRKPLVSSLAGRWYDADPARLRAGIDGYLDSVDAETLPGVLALILPHAGYRWSGEVAAHGLRRVRGKSFSRVVVLGPTHRVPMENVASVPGATHYVTPLGEVPLDTAFLDALRRHPHFRTIPPAHEGEHSVQIQVPLLQVALGPFRLVPIVVGRLDRDTTHAMARVLRGLVDRETLVVVSSDFTHYGARFDYVPFRDDIAENLRSLDLGACGAIEARDADAFADYVSRTGATICGRHAIGLLLAMLDPDTKVHRLTYDTSGRAMNDYTSSVSYLAVAFTGGWGGAPRVPPGEGPGTLSGQERRLLLDLARRALRHALETGDIPDEADLGVAIPDVLRRPGAAFVSVHNHGRLRGCRGLIFPTMPLFRTVLVQAVQSGLFDDRFEPVRQEELPDIDLSISVLTEPRHVASCEEIEIGRHGIILEKAGRRALFLPQVAPEQGWDLPTTLTHLARKAGLPPDAWKEGASFEVFEAEVFGEAGE